MKHSLTEFLGAFYPDVDEPIWLLGFPAKKLPPGHPDLNVTTKRQITRRTLAADRALQTSLKLDNERVGLYFCVNAGGTKKEEINRINAVFCEIDDLPIAEQHELYDGCSLQPSIRVETLKSVHAYWLLVDTMSTTQWESVQHALIDRFSADEHLKNCNRVMRLPFFSHIRWDEGYQFKPVKLHTFDVDTRYTTAHLRSAFPYTASTNSVFDTKAFGEETWEDANQELRWRISRLPSYRVEANHQWATAKGICHDGNNNTALSVNLRNGAVSCKAGCDFDRILSVFGLSKPVRKQALKYVPARKQSGELYEFVKSRQMDAEEREAIRMEGCGLLNDGPIDFDQIQLEAVGRMTA